MAISIDEFGQRIVGQCGSRNCGNVVDFLFLFRVVVDDVLGRYIHVSAYNVHALVVEEVTVLWNRVA